LLHVPEKKRARALKVLQLRALLQLPARLQPLLLRLQLVRSKVTHNSLKNVERVFSGGGAW
jgi:hypothetical protein